MLLLADIGNYVYILRGAATHSKILHPVFGILSSVLIITQPFGRGSAIFLVSFFVVSSVITFIGTSLIILCIVVVTRRIPLTTHTSTYRNIQRIVVESGLIYTIFMMITGITISVNTVRSSQPSIPAGELGAYAQALLVPISVRPFCIKSLPD